MISSMGMTRSVGRRNNQRTEVYYFLTKILLKIKGILPIDTLYSY